MEKRIEELTLGEVHKICNKSVCCANCPLYAFEYGCAKESIKAYEHIKCKKVDIIESKE